MGRTLRCGAIAAMVPLMMPAAAAAQTVTPVDLGTLGGGSAWGQAINARGAVVGTSETADGSLRPFIAPRPGTLSAVGPSDTPAVGLGINDLGDVVGESGRAFAIVGGRLRVLGPGLANDINNLRQAAGWRPATPEETHATVWEPSGRIRDLGRAGEQSFASAINDRGDVAGWYTDAEGLAHAVVWRAGGSRLELGTLGGRYSQAMAINEAGDVAGVAETAEGAGRAFLWRRDTGTMELIDTGPFSWAFGLNDARQVVGEHLDEDGRLRAFVWSAAAGLTRLATPQMPDAVASRATAINDLGEITGLVANATEARALRWTVRPSAAEQLSGIERVIRLMVRDRSSGSARVAAPLAQVRAASRALRSGRTALAAAHLRTAARQLGTLAKGSVRGRLLHLQVVIQRLSVHAGK